MKRERDIEKELIRKVKDHGGMALKFVSPGLSGVPDRLLLFPGGRVVFAEVKAPGKKLRPLQMKRKKQIESLGFKVYSIDDGVMIDEICSS